MPIADAVDAVETVEASETVEAAAPVDIQITVCHNCSAALFPDVAFCDECGAKVIKPGEAQVSFLHS